ncbi:beta strand repeat-containing protein, partial [Endozoicomonas numazuensis]|uniref:beta strand repeat-containing protein n=1 Tax=Endozoicomonas numazuensis TaxID=1137799 RepID=UPI00055672DC
GSKTYIGGASTIDTVTDNTVSAWDLTGNQALSNGTHNLSHVDQLNTSGDITDKNDGNWSVSGNKIASSTNYNVVIDGTGRIVTAGSVTNTSTSDQTVELNASSLKVAEITFDGSKTYIGSTTQTDTVEDTTGADWKVTGVKALTDDSRTLSNVDQLNASGDITDEGSTAWSVDGKNLISSADQELTISGTRRLNTAGDITDKDNTAWSVDGKNLISSSTQGITVSGTKSLTTQGNITDTTNKGWAVQGDNVAFSSDNALTIDGTGQITTVGGITNDSGETQTVNLNSNNISVAGIAFMGSTAYTGRDANDDTVVDNNKNDWSLTALNTANDGNYYLSKVGGLTSTDSTVTSSMGTQEVTINSDHLLAGDIQFKGINTYVGSSAYDSVNDTQVSNWSVTGDYTANNTTYSFSNINEVNTTGEVTNNINADDQQVTVDGDSIFLAGIDFIGSRVFNGSADYSELVIDSSNRDWTLAAANQLTGNGFTLNEVDQVTTEGGITDGLDSNWTLQATGQGETSKANSVDAGITLVNSTRI